MRCHIVKGVVPKVIVDDEGIAPFLWSVLSGRNPLPRRGNSLDMCVVTEACWGVRTLANLDTEVDLTRKLQAVEHDRIELVQQAVEVLRSIQSGNQVELTEALAGVIGFGYLLAVQMGVAPHRIDHDIVQAFQVTAEQDKLRTADLAEVARYLKNRG